MFRAYLGPSSGGTTVCIQQLVLIILFRWLSLVLRTTDSHLFFFTHFHKFLCSLINALLQAEKCSYFRSSTSNTSRVRRILISSRQWWRSCKSVEELQISVVGEQKHRALNVCSILSQETCAAQQHRERSAVIPRQRSNIHYAVDNTRESTIQMEGAVAFPWQHCVRESPKTYTACLIRITFLSYANHKSFCSWGPQFLILLLIEITHLS
jgi:hypothetical protein